MSSLDNATKAGVRPAAPTRKAGIAPASSHHFETLESRTLLSAAAADAGAGQMDVYSRTADVYTFELNPAQPLTAGSGARKADAKVGGRTIAPQPAPASGVRAGAAFAAAFSAIAIAPDPALVIDAPGDWSGHVESAAEEAMGGRALTASSTHSFAGRPPEHRPTRMPAEPGHHVLLVEDDPASRLALGAILKKHGWKVTSASNLAEGMRNLALHPDHVIVDLMLPDGDGSSLLKRVRDEHLPVHVTVTTAVSDPARLARVRGLHPDSMLNKPLNVAELLRGLDA